MKKFTLLTVVVLSLLLASVGAAAASNAKTTFTARLGDESGTGSEAHGTAVFVFADDGSELSFKLVANGIENVTMAHIHVAGTPGGNGPIVLWLYPETPPAHLIEGVFNGLLGTGTATSANLTGNAGVTTLQALRQAVEEGRAYVNVHTSAFPGGEIRGQIE